MNQYPLESTSLGRLFLRSVGLHFSTFKHAFLFIILMSFTKSAGYFISNAVSNPVGSWFLVILFLLIFVYFAACTIFSTHLSISGEKQTIKEVVMATVGRYPKIVICCALYIGMALLANFLSNFMIDVLARFFSHSEKNLHLFAFVIGAAITFMFVAMFSYVFPLCSMSDKSIRSIFYDSLILTAENRLGVILLFALSFVLFVLVSPTLLLDYYLAKYHISFLFDLLVFVIIFPIITNYILLLINDSKCKVQLNIE